MKYYSPFDFMKLFKNIKVILGLASLIKNSNNRQWVGVGPWLEVTDS